MTKMTQIDRYEVLSECGSGGMSKVYHAYDPDLDKEVAVKLIRATISDDPQYQDRFRQECRLLANLDHPAIVPILNVGQYADRPYFVMPFMTGGSLKQRLLSAPIALDDALSIVERIAAALDVAHAQGIVHRDIKPHNILFDADDVAYLADFGIARLLDSEKTLHTMTMIGTPEYMAPEQVLEGSLSQQTDIYQLGVVLFQMLSGSRPFEGAAHHVMTQHLHAEVPAVSELNAKVPPTVDQVITKAMAKESHDRFATASEFASALKVAVTPVHIGRDAAVLGAVARGARWDLRPAAWVVGIGTTFAILLLGATLTFQNAIPREVRGVINDITEFIGLDNGRRRADLDVAPVQQTVEIDADIEVAEIDVVESEAVSGEIAFVVTPTLSVAPTDVNSAPTEVVPTATEPDIAADEDGAEMEARVEAREETLAQLETIEPTPTVVPPTLAPTAIPPTTAPTAVPTAEPTVAAEAQQNTIGAENAQSAEPVNPPPAAQQVVAQDDDQQRSPRGQNGQNNGGNNNGDGGNNGNGDGNGDGQRPPRGGRRGGGNN